MRSLESRGGGARSRGRNAEQQGAATIGRLAREFPGFCRVSHTNWIPNGARDEVIFQARLDQVYTVGSLYSIYIVFRRIIMLCQDSQFLLWELWTRGHVGPLFRGKSEITTSYWLCLLASSGRNRKLSRARILIIELHQSTPVSIVNYYTLYSTFSALKLIGLSNHNYKQPLTLWAQQNYGEMHKPRKDHNRRTFTQPGGGGGWANVRKVSRSVQQFMACSVPRGL